MEKHLNRHRFFCVCIVLALALASITGTPSVAADRTGDSFLGTWSFHLPDGNPVWLRIAREDHQHIGELLWSVGSARPVKDLEFDQDQITFVRNVRWKPFGDAANEKQIKSPMVARLENEQLTLTVIQVGRDGRRETMTLLGSRMPPMPQTPKLSEIEWGEPIELFNGVDLSGWRLSNPNKENGWSVRDGVLQNETPKEDFGAYGEYGNLRTEKTFEDFELSLEYNVPVRGNSGVYLRGAYEAQVVDRDSPMQGISGPGAIFGRIVPSENAARPGGQWNQYRLTLVDRHISVELNDVLVIDNQPIIGCTGGGILSDDTKPGPILLQGDHTSVQYRNMTLRPVIGRKAAD